MKVTRRVGRRLLTVGLAGLLAMSAGTGAAEPPAGRRSPPSPPSIADPTLREASGLAPSLLDPTLLWALDDSGAPPVLHAIGTDGRARGLVDVVGAENVDWEDLATFRWRGRSWILVADVGDNDAARPEVVLYILPEPRTGDLVRGVRLAVPIAWRLVVRYPDGPADCESVAVDAREGKVYLLTKRTRPPILYSAPLHPARRGAAGTPIVARREAALTAFPNPSLVLLPTPAGLFPGMPTGMSFARDGTAAAVLTYDQLYLFRRGPGETWSAALQRAPERLGKPGLWQAEAVAVSRDGRSIYVTGEGRAQPLLRFDLPRPAPPAAPAPGRDRRTGATPSPRHRPVASLRRSVHGDRGAPGASRAR